MIKKGFLSVLVVGMALVLASSHSDAARYKYEETDVKNGGTITGVVNLKGEPPPPIMENLKKGK
ncbi:MAG: carboxypeptidase regulatory-like domain-containing protein, partial [Nitrospinaceae bacterium]|nr:carboxypeptidase regulatory-like domain-containing protein [Nitrospinaceae bacterium]NIR56360.1 carboxypeptidase regulatory-like domain-containing protein [Nitrospinaceae bacterium]NIS86822.1 carboxypeptidase regulatory-like domain-containing protein [Nitrospinaceae bacterium]NIT83658.1 carboxypeptidase regulatory-like domain-containing protein [Nitrospinaceae bacterium]NIU45856.1 carboxypeptidase regulatory-like domain-containing protein [Nitrospinaceae bacterium]